MQHLNHTPSPMLTIPGARAEIRRLTRQLTDCDRELARLRHAIQQTNNPVHRIAFRAHRVARDATALALQSWIGDLN